ncbi:MAG TPA: 30S ribosome-binding factor RbfA [Actinomycetota bacterium]|jgi:ribosome-binding factor A|nr:30S ribosome-binding factor RbfA [Actinomycetota bacterium]
MPKNYPRSNRVEELARQVLSEAVQELKDPRVGFVTVTAVKIAKDLRLAQVYVSAMGTEEEQEKTFAGLRHAQPHLRSVMGREIRLRRTPELEIVQDRTAQTSQRLEELLRNLGVSQAPDAGRTLEDAESGEPDAASREEDES